MIGPLSSPALVKKQVVGVFDKKLLKIFANALKNLNIKFAWIVNSEDGLDEISPYAKTNIIQLKDNKISEIVIDPKKLTFTTRKVLTYVPSAVFPAIIFPAVFLNKNGIFINIYSPQVLAFMVAIMIGYYSKNVILTILGGLVSYWFLIYFLNQV